MGVVDEQGRLFGVVNVIDLAVVLVVVSTLVAGAVFVLVDDEDPPEPGFESEDRYVTVVLDARPGGSVPTLDSDGAMAPSESVTVGGVDGQVTDTYVAPTDEGGFVTIARIRVTVSAASANLTTDRRLVTDDRNLSVGQGIRLNDDVSYRGYVHAVDRSGADLPVRTVTTTVVTTIPPSVADRVEAGDTQVVAGSEVARLVRVDRQQAMEDRTRVEVDVALRVFDPDGAPLYGTQYVRPGAELRVAPSGYEFWGTVTGVT